MGKIKEFLEEKIKSRLIRKIYKTESPEWIIIKMIKPSEKTKKKLNLPDDFRYYVMLNLKTKELTCDCLGFLTHKKCKHVKYFRSILNLINADGNSK